MSTLRRLSFLAFLLCYGVVVFGAYVRLSHAGLGCPDWPGCYGHFTVPQAQHELSQAQENFPTRPVEAHKAWKEMIHRYLASALGVLIVLLAVLAQRAGHTGLKHLTRALIGTVLLQGALGALTVLWQVNPITVTAHLLVGMTTLALLLWTYLTARAMPVVAAGERREREARSERQAWFVIEKAQYATPALRAPWSIRIGATLALVLLAAQIFLGGWTSSNYAALACPDLPTCHGAWWPETDPHEAFTLWRGLGINYEHGVLDNRERVTIHFFHRLGAVALTLALLLLAAALHRAGGVWRKYALALVAALVVQLALGISMVKLQLPLLLADLHNAGAALLLTVLLAVNFRARQPRA